MNTVSLMKQNTTQTLQQSHDRLLKALKASRMVMMRDKPLEFDNTDHETDWESSMDDLDRTIRVAEQFKA